MVVPEAIKKFSAHRDAADSRKTFYNISKNFSCNSKHF